MAGELRSATFSVSIDGQEKGSSIVAITRDLKGLVGVEEELNKTSATNVTVTKSQTTTQKEANAVARAAISDYNKQQKAIKYVTDQIEQETKMLMMSADEQQIFNAQMKAGVQPLSDAGLKIESLIKKQQTLAAASGKTGGSFRGLRGQAQNLGWQMQDVAVQMQMGTDAMVILSQQGSQLASGLGPTGAIVGALIAVGGAVAGVALSTKGMKEEQELAKATVTGLTKDLYEQAKAGKELNATQRQHVLLIQEEKATNYREQIKDQTKAMQEQAEEVARLRGLSEQRGGKRGTSAAVDQANDDLIRLRSLLKSSEDELKQIEENRDAILSGDKFDIDKSAPTQFDASLGQLEQSETKKHIQIMAALYAKRRELKYDDYEGQHKLDKLFEAEDKRMYQLRLDGIKDQQEIALAEYTLAEKIAKQQFDISAKNTAGLEAAFARQKQLKIDRLISENNFQSDMNQLLSLGADESIIRQYEQYEREAAISLSQIKAQALQDYEAGIISKEQLEKREIEAAKANKEKLVVLAKEKKDALFAMQMETVENNIATASMLASSMTATVDILSTGGESILEQMEGMNAAQKSLFFLTQSIAAATAIVNGIDLGSKLAAMFPLAAPAMITTGASIGAAQAGAIMGVTIAGAFDKGGIIPNGQAGIVSEYGDELVGGTMVFNNSGGGLPVTGREDTAKLLSNSSNGTVVNIKIDSTDAPGVQYSQGDTDVDGTIKIIAQQVFNDSIDGGVASVLSKKNTKADKAMRANYNSTRTY